MTRVHLQPGQATALDALEIDALVLPMFAARVQPRGVAGHADWRLCGRIAQLMRRDLFVGHASEALLMPTDGRIGPNRVFLFGLGTAEGGPAATSRERLTDMARALVEAGAQQYAIGFPVVPGTPPESEHAGDPAWAIAWLEAVTQWRAQVERVVLLDDDGSLAASAGALRQRARDLGLLWED